MCKRSHIDLEDESEDEAQEQATTTCLCVSEDRGVYDDALASEWLLSLARAPPLIKPKGLVVASPKAAASTVKPPLSPPVVPSAEEEDLIHEPNRKRLHQDVPSITGSTTVASEMDKEDTTAGDGDGDKAEDEDSRLSSPASLPGHHEKKSSQAAIRAAKSITLDELRTYFNKPIEEAARAIGICSTLLKKICRRYNIRRWPYRQIKSLDRTIDCLRVAAQSAGPSDKGRFHHQIHVLEGRRTDLIETSALGGCPPPPNNMTASSSTSSSCSSSSSNGCSWPAGFPTTSYSRPYNKKPNYPRHLSPGAASSSPSSSDVMNLAALVHQHLSVPSDSPTQAAGESTLARFLKGTLAPSSRPSASQPGPRPSPPTYSMMPPAPYDYNDNTPMPPYGYYPMTAGNTTSSSPPHHHYDYPYYQQQPADPHGMGIMGPGGYGCYYSSPPSVSFA